MAENELPVPENVMPAEDEESRKEIDQNGDKEKENEIEFNMEEFSCKTAPTDVTLMVEGKPIPINKALLAFVSPVFDAMFSGDFKEKDAIEFPLPGKEFNEFVEFLRCLYPNIMKRITSENVDVVLPLAHEYQVEHLVTACENALIKLLEGKDNKEEVYSLAMTAVKYDLNELREKCIEEAASRPLNEIKLAGRNYAFSIDLMNEIKARLLDNWTDKYKDAPFHINTTKVFCMLLGDKSNEQELTTQYANGNVFGDFMAMRVDVGAEFKSSISVNSVWLDLEIKKATASYGSTKYRLFIKRHHPMRPDHCLSQHSVRVSSRYICFVKVINWMEKNRSISKRSEFTLDGTSNNQKVLTLLDANQLKESQNYSSGYIRDGKLDIEFYLFEVK